MLQDKNKPQSKPFLLSFNIFYLQNTYISGNFLIFKMLDHFHLNI